MVRLECSRNVAAPVEHVYDRVLPVRLETFLGGRYLALPGVASVEQSGPWGRDVGQTRTLHFTDGGRATEVLTVLERPGRFGYDLTETAGPLSLLARTVHGLWSFRTETPTSTRVTWTWDVEPTLLGRLVLPAFGLMWRGMAARALARIDDLAAA